MSMPLRRYLQKPWVKFPLEVLFFVLLYLGLRAYMQRDMAQGLAPDFQATTLNQQAFQLTEVSKPVLVHFWATWCGICKLEQASIQAISADYPVITIAMQSGSDVEIQDYLNEHQLDFAVINDQFGELSARYGVQGVPASFIVNSQREIVAAERGYTTEWGLRLRLWWAK
jgi:thiol-disulfide isomerase/thioredoxin